ncbi:MAG TPA: amidohydrolase family protein [Spirochaetia bacterium]|nr:amidohydrolase family protein [Spirochaetia bacterium]
MKHAHVLFEGNTVRGVSTERGGDFMGKFPVITPAFIDAHSHIGMERSGEPGTEGEANERMDTMLFLADALDSVQMDDTAFRDSVEMGVLYSCVLPGSGNIVGGRSAIIRNFARTTTDALFARSGIKAAFGYNPMSTREWKGTRPHTRMGSLSLLRSRLAQVRKKLEATRGKKSASKTPGSELTAEDEVVREILESRVGLRIHVHKIDDIASLLRLQEEFGVRVTVDHACDVNDGHIYSVLRERGIPVVFGPLDAFAYKVELKHENWRNVRFLIESGVDFGLMTDHPVIPQRNLALELRWFMRCGLSRQDAIEIITRRNAEILGIDGQLGTLEKGKWASFSCWNGDPFDITRYPVKVVAEGNTVFEEPGQ